MKYFILHKYFLDININKYINKSSRTYDHTIDFYCWVCLLFKIKFVPFLILSTGEQCWLKEPRVCME